MKVTLFLTQGHLSRAAGLDSHPSTAKPRSVQEVSFSFFLFFIAIVYSWRGRESWEELRASERTEAKEKEQARKQAGWKALSSLAPRAFCLLEKSQRSAQLAVM